MDPVRLKEYAALRATIRDRGTARVWLFWAGIVGWATLVVAETAIGSLPIVSLVPLLVLAATFEAIYALHTGVERVGRYLQVVFEEQRDAGSPAGLRWETAAMTYGRLFPARGPDPLFSGFFILAAVLNLIPTALAGPVPAELGLLGVIHLLFIVRLIRARTVAAGQRARDLERFRMLAHEQADTPAGASGSASLAD
ncbi:MAG TPA: hypothetical protein VND92_05120 [Vicinamibacterales bacterium]|nr:hypothetical protein [Vicinamibacterales bacterium]